MRSYWTNIVDRLLSAVMVGNPLARHGIENQLRPVRIVSILMIVKVKHPINRSGDRIRRSVADSAKIPVVFDKAKNGGLVGNAMVDVVALRKGRNDQQRL